MEGVTLTCTIISSVLGGSVITELVRRLIPSKVEERTGELAHIENLQNEVRMLWERLKELSDEHTECQDQLTSMKLRVGKQDVEIEIMKRALAGSGT